MEEKELAHFIQFMKKYKDAGENCLRKTLEYHICLTEKILREEEFYVKVYKKETPALSFMVPICIIGYYDKQDKSFNWKNKKNISEFIKKSFEKNEMKQNYETVENLFTEKISISLEDHYSIPYFIYAFSKMFSLVKFMGLDENIILYTLVKLEEKNTINFDQFTEDINILCNLHREI
jgi:hypothetical protein